jgi:hypothetical protein
MRRSNTFTGGGGSAAAATNQGGGFGLGKRVPMPAEQSAEVIFVSYLLPVHLVRKDDG